MESTSSPKKMISVPDKLFSVPQLSARFHLQSVRWGITFSPVANHFQSGEGQIQSGVFSFSPVAEQFQSGGSKIQSSTSCSPVAYYSAGRPQIWCLSRPGRPGMCFSLHTLLGGTARPTGKILPSTYTSVRHSPAGRESNSFYIHFWAVQPGRPGI